MRPEQRSKQSPELHEAPDVGRDHPGRQQGCKKEAGASDNVPKLPLFPSCGSARQGRSDCRPELFPEGVSEGFFPPAAASGSPADCSSGVVQPPPSAL